jgi:ATP-binding cassette subfamily F protein 3
MLQIKDLSYRLGPRVLFSSLQFSVPAGAKVGVVGPNGAGKTTLFRILLGELTPDSGEICYPSGYKFVHVRQEMENENILLINSVLAADKNLMKLRQQINDSETDVMHMADLYDALGAAGGFDAESRAKALLSGLGFCDENMEDPLRTFSGGWQVRAALASTLFAPSDCLLLDEPTNHLDLETAIWLENHLQQLKKSMFIISHEKAFFNNICDHILHVYNGAAQLFRGNYDTFCQSSQERRRSLEAESVALERKREHLQSFVDRFGAKASKAKQAQSRKKMLDKLGEVQPPPPVYGVTFRFPPPTPKIDRRYISLENAAIGYGENIILRNVNLRIDEGSRTALLGANGNGKSTLAKAMAGQIPIADGARQVARGLKIAYFSQHQGDMLNLDQTPIRLFCSRFHCENETQARSQLAQFGIIRERSTTLIRHLSGGEKTRLLLALETLQQPHLLILDEPTNHLDIEAREALALALNFYGGAVLLVTHDFQTLLDCCKDFCIVEGGTCRKFKGTINSYRQSLVSFEKNSH